MVLPDEIQNPLIDHTLAKIAIFAYLATETIEAGAMCACCFQPLLSSFRGLRDLFFPRRCVVCGRLLDENEEDLCPDCFTGLPLTYQWDLVQNAAFERLAQRFDVEAAAALLYFGSESDYRKILYAIKYGGRRRLGYRMGFVLGEKLAGSPAFRACQAVVPVPLHPLRRWKRGYNQAEVIGRGVAAATKVPLETKLLHRNRYTQTQTRLHGEAKTKNVDGAFRLDPERAARLRHDGVRDLLLIDDVLTTGSTLSACAAPLQAAGFRIYCATLAFAG